MDDIYLSVEFWSRHHQTDQPATLLHSAIVTREEIARHLSEYRGQIHVFTGVYLHDEVSQMSLAERGLAHLETQS
jgi:hypothetical protein